jgi:phage shock protein PspC (stress-responsive transcriptional regulator)
MKRNRLTKSDEDSVLFGVCSGIANYIHIDPVFVRIIMVALLFLMPDTFWVYMILMFIIPDE